ncbi:MAG: hypothetical protein U1E46_10795 [Hyphomicrobiales bacterium]
MARLLKVFVLFPLMAALLTWSSVEAQAASPSHKIEFRLVRGGFIVGVGSGSGNIWFNGKRWPFSVGGVSMGATIGLASVDFVGRAYNVRNVHDIQGTYTVVGTGVAVAGGASSARLRNSRGVILEVRGRQVGFMASIDMSGLTIRMSR